MKPKSWIIPRAVALLSGFLATFPALAQEPLSPPPADPPSVSRILADNDRALLRDLATYLKDNPAAVDRDQAYLVLFERAIENDWYVENEASAQAYLKASPDGPVAPLARIVATMSEAEKGDFDQSLTTYKALIKGLNDPSQEEFAVNFADSLARSALDSGRGDVARIVYETLLTPFADSPSAQQKVSDELSRIDMVGRPAPPIVVQDLDGKTLRLSDLRGRYVLVDFWATWCTPYVDDLPKLRKLEEELRDKGLEVVAVSLDENPQAVSDFARARGIPWRQLHQGSSKADLVAAFKVGSIPASYLIGPDGTVLRINLRGESLEKTLRELVK